MNLMPIETNGFPEIGAGLVVYEKQVFEVKGGALSRRADSGGLVVMETLFCFTKSF